jgi:cytochrome P450
LYKLSIFSDFKGRANFIGIYQMRSPRVFILDPQMAKDVLVKNFKHFRENEFSKMFEEKDNPLFARNPFLARADSWKEKRTEISPAFSSNRMKAMHPLVESVCNRLTSYINTNINEPFEGKVLALKFLIEAVAICVFGIEANTLQKEDSELQQMSKRLTKPSAMTIIKVIISAIFPPLQKFMKIQFIADDVNAFFLNLFDQAFDYRTKSKIERDDYLDFLITLQKKKGFSSTDIAGHSITFFSDGIESSSVLISHMLYEVRL